MTDAVGVLKSMKAIIGFLSSILMTLVLFSPPASAADYSTNEVNKTSGLTAKSWAIPRPVTDECTVSAIELSLKGGGVLRQGSPVLVSTSAPDGDFVPQTGSVIAGIARFTVKNPITRSNPKKSPVSIKLCHSDLLSADQTHILVKVVVDSSQFKPSGNFVIVRMDIVDDAVSIGAKSVIGSCIANSTAPQRNLTVGQISSAKISRDKWTKSINGATVNLEGTLFQQGVAMKQTNISFFEAYLNKRRAWQFPGRLLKTVTTDSLGQFEVSLKLKRQFPESSSDVMAISDPSIQPIGSQAVVFGGTSVDMKFDWLLSPGNYVGSRYDLPPSLSTQCEAAYASFVDALDQQTEDENNRLARYIVMREAGRWFSGFKESGVYKQIQCYDSSWGAACNYVETGYKVQGSNDFGVMGTRCYHRSGHTRKTESGKTTYVRSHRVCR